MFNLRASSKARAAEAALLRPLCRISYPSIAFDR